MKSALDAIVRFGVLGKRVWGLGFRVKSVVDAIVKFGV